MHVTHMRSCQRKENNLTQRSHVASSAACSTAVFEVGSKLAHTCSSPNTTYQSCMGRGCHVALQDIAQGQLLTTCYLHADDLVMSTFARLAGPGFWLLKVGKPKGNFAALDMI